jgi:5-methylcytosine-specific restriction endonuclease McrA
MRRHGGICHVCGGGDSDQVDHVIPLEEGGPDTDENKRPIHAVPCHREKTAAEAARARARNR